MIFLAFSSMHAVINSRVPADYYVFLTMLFFCYLVGAASTSYILAKWLKGVDIRTFGSGNSGATNTSRLLGRHYFFIILGLDAGKAYAMLAIAQMLLPEMTIFGSLCCAGAILLGNAFSVFIKFRGGKAVATGAGLLVYFLPVSLVICYLSAFAGVLLFAKRVDVAALSAVLIGALCVAKSGLAPIEVIYAAWLLALWVWLRHWQNVLYLLGMYKPIR